MSIATEYEPVRREWARMTERRTGVVCADCSQPEPPHPHTWFLRKLGVKDHPEYGPEEVVEFVCPPCRERDDRHNAALEGLARLAGVDLADCWVTPDGKGGWTFHHRSESA